MTKKLAVLLGAMLAMMMSGCTNTPAYNRVAIGATNGNGSVTAARDFPCAWTGAMRNLRCHPMDYSLRERYSRR